MFTDQQENFFSVALSTTDHVALIARAGTGKTFSLVELASRFAAEGQSGILAVAFNKSIAEELSERMPRAVDTSTMHSLGFKTLRGALDTVKFKIDGNKYTRLARDHGYDWETASKLSRVVDMLRTNVIPEDQWTSSAGMFLEEIGEDSDLAKVVVELLVEGTSLLTTKGLIDFTDMLWSLVHLQLRPSRKYEIIMVDEAQDLNPLQQVVIRKYLSAAGRFIICGDPKQAIYGFAGASADGINSMVGALKKPTRFCEISKTFRCGHAIVREAIVQGGPDGKLANYQSAVDYEGEVKVLTEADVDVHSFVEGDAIICRTNRPLMEAAVWFLANEVGFKLAGKEFIKQLKTRMTSGLKDTQDKVFAKRKVDKWLEDRIAYAEEMGRPSLADRHKDVAECCHVFINLPHIRTVGDIKKSLDALETDRPGPVLSSIHKAKGLEWSRVWWLDHAGHMGKMIKNKENEDPESQEWNLRYVCATRAKHTLIKINTLPLDTEEQDQ